MSAVHTFKFNAILTPLKVIEYATVHILWYIISCK